MKKLVIFIFSFMLIFIFVACDKNTTTLTETTAVNQTTNDLLTSTRSEENTDNSTAITTVTDDTETSTDQTTEIIPLDNLETEELPIHSTIYGTTNGNANNLGLAVYDTVNKLHYYAVGSSVYAYDPSTKETSLLFTSTVGGYIRNLCLIDNLLYFVSTADLYLKAYEIETGNFQIIYEDETYYVQSYYNDVFIEALKTTTSSTYKAILKYYHDDKEFLTTTTTGMEFINVSGTRLYHFYTSEMNITVIGGSFTGRSKIYSLDEHEITEVTELHLIKASYSGELTFAIVAST
ncbi:MAG: hypothetical protein RBR66_04505, partial [Candidatus Izemoplasmatales bacterium]|nr:hypothetical protein [Candidatus Izemoplasmatales bacterium]